MIQAIKNFWFGLSDDTRAHIISAVKVFLASFLTTVLITAKDGIHWDAAFFYSILTTALNNGFKALIETYAPPSLGGIKK